MHLLGCWGSLDYLQLHNIVSMQNSPLRDCLFFVEILNLNQLSLHLKGVLFKEHRISSFLLLAVHVSSEQFFDKSPINMKACLVLTLKLGLDQGINYCLYISLTKVESKEWKYEQFLLGSEHLNEFGHGFKSALH